MKGKSREEARGKRTLRFCFQDLSRCVVGLSVTAPLSESTTSSATSSLAAVSTELATLSPVDSPSLERLSSFDANITTVVPTSAGLGFALCVARKLSFFLSRQLLRSGSTGSFGLGLGGVGSMASRERWVSPVARAIRCSLRFCDQDLSRRSEDIVIDSRSSEETVAISSCDSECRRVGGISRRS